MYCGNFFVFYPYFLSVVVSLIVSTSLVDCLQILVSEVTYYVSIGTLNSAYLRLFSSSHECC